MANSEIIRREQGRGSPLGKALSIAALMAAAGIVLVLLPPACKKGISTHTVKKDKLLIAQVKKGSFRETIQVTGKILPVNIVYLDALEGGRVEKIFVEAGSMVKQNDPILQLSNTTLLMDIMWRESELFQQSNNLRNTRLSMEQFKLQLGTSLGNKGIKFSSQKKKERM
jgi:HlyD family secretion protein